MTQKEAEQLAEEFKDLVLRRTGIQPEDLSCPREKSDMTPCAARDGHLVAVLNSRAHPLCVGCGHSLVRLVEEERTKHAP